VTYTPILTLTVQGGSTGTGFVSSTPSGFSCSINGANESGVCSSSYSRGTQVTLHADPSGGSFIDRWSVSSCGTATSCTVVMDQTRTVTVFLKAPPDCMGDEVGGFCWYLGAENRSCTDVCASHGGYHEATRFFAGSDGSNDNCMAVLGALGYPSGQFSETLQGGIGCFAVISIETFRLRDTQPTTASATSGTPGRRRVCACQN
jgi:hypothetical protein